MKQAAFHYLFLLLLCVLFLGLNAQQSNRGGFGYLTLGAGSIQTASAQNKLQGSNVLGNDFSFNNAGLLIGGKGFGLFNRVLIGGGGYGVRVMGTSKNGQAEYIMAGGGLNVGYVLKHKTRSMFYSYLGIGGTGGTIVVKNNGTTPMRFSANQEIPANENRTLSGGGIGFEFGVGFLKTIAKDENSTGGFMLGVIGGVNYLPTERWEFVSNGTTISGLGNRSSIYLGITIGAGGNQPTKK